MAYEKFKFPCTRQNLQLPGFDARKSAVEFFINCYSFVAITKEFFASLYTLSQVIDIVFFAGTR